MWKPTLAVLSLAWPLVAAAQVDRTASAARADARLAPRSVTDTAGGGAGGGEAPAGPHIQHVPENELIAGATRLRFSVQRPDLVQAVIVFVRAAGAAQAREFAALRVGDGYAVLLPAEVVQPPGFAYWVVARVSGQLREVFASAEDAHAVAVRYSDAYLAEQRRLTQRGGHRSRAEVSAEWVDFGHRRLSADGPRTPDRFYRVRAGYSHAFLSTVEEIALHVVRVRGESGELLTEGGRESVQRVRPGTDYGQAAITLLAFEGVRLQGSFILGASQEGFEYGAGGALIFGNPYGLHLAMTSEGISTLGITAGMRMGFLIAAGVPMGAGVEVSNFPVGEDTGVRLVCDLGYELGGGSLIALRGGFQGRTSVTGGPTLGGSFRYAF